MDRRSFITGTVTGVAGGAMAGTAGTLWFERWAGGAPAHGRSSFSQQGEDIVIYHLMHDLLKIPAPTYLDIGAADPIQSNNTYLLYGTGGHGVLVEPNPVYAAKLRTFRPKDIVLNVGIGFDERREADYYMIRDAPMLNTFSADQVAILQRGTRKYAVEKVVKLPLVPVNEVIAAHFGGRAPDLLSIDVEGLDLTILKTLDFDRYRPGGIIAETVRMGTSHENSAITEFLLTRDYIPRGGSLVNTIYADTRRYA